MAILRKLGVQTSGLGLLGLPAAPALLSVLALLSALVLLGAATAPTARAREVIRITDNDFWDSEPAISGSNVVWYASVGSHYEIFLWDGATISNISNNDDFDDFNVSISGSTVVWRGRELSHRGNSEVFYWDGGSPVRVTTNFGYDGAPSVDGSNVVWSSDAAGPSEIFLWDGSTTTNISNRGGFDGTPSISGSNVVWYGTNAGRYDVFLWDGEVVNQLTDTPSSEFGPDVSGSNAAWRFCEGPLAPTCGQGLTDWEIVFWDGSEATQITHNHVYDSDPKISGESVVWARSDGNDSELFLWNRGRTFQLTDNDVHDLRPDISGTTVVFEGWDGNDYEIFTMDVADLINRSILPVDVDILPGSEPNLINPLSPGVVSAAILGSDVFDIADIDVTTLAFGPDGAAPRNRNGGHLADVNSDGLTDLVSQYRVQETGITFGDEQACVTGETLDGAAIEGCDVILTNPCGNGFELALILPLFWLRSAPARRRRMS